MSQYVAGWHSAAMLRATSLEQRETTAGITLACGFEDFFVAWNLPQRRAIGDAREDGIRRNAGGREFHGELADVRFQRRFGRACRTQK